MVAYDFKLRGGAKKQDTQTLTAVSRILKQ